MEAQVNGIKLHYEDHGQGKAVLLVHAFPLAGAMWQQQVAALKGQYRLIVPDMRGFGASEGTPRSHHYGNIRRRSGCPAGHVGD